MHILIVHYAKNMGWGWVQAGVGLIWVPKNVGPKIIKVTKNWITRKSWVLKKSESPKNWVPDKNVGHKKNVGLENKTEMTHRHLLDLTLRSFQQNQM